MTSGENHLIELLPRNDRTRLLRVCEPVDLTLEQVLSGAGKPAPYAYFPRSSFISLVAPIDGKPMLEVGMVGREGMLGAHLALGVPVAPFHSIVQGAGAAWRIGSIPLGKELHRSAPLQRCLNRYLYVLMSQLAASAACLRFHQIGPRLARWLLMTQDRAHADAFRVTHEFLSYMLGVRRVGITEAAGDLQRRELIQYRRGQLQVLDRKGLEAAACGCYTLERRMYTQLLH
jgi:CRP-like cAMP-binding protein